MAIRLKTAMVCLVGLLMLVAVTGWLGGPLTVREKGTLLGGGVGEVAGTIIGVMLGTPAAGAAIWGALGAGEGFLVGAVLHDGEIRQAHTEGQLQDRQANLQRQRQRGFPENLDRPYTAK